MRDYFPEALTINLPLLLGRTTLQMCMDSLIAWTALFAFEFSRPSTSTFVFLMTSPRNPPRRILLIWRLTNLFKRIHTSACCWASLLGSYLVYIYMFTKKVRNYKGFELKGVRLWIKGRYRKNNLTKSAAVNFIKLQSKILTDHITCSVWIYQMEVSPVCWSLGFCIKDIVIFSKVLNFSVWSVWISLDSATDENKLETGCCCIRVLTLEVKNIWTRACSFLETKSVQC